jgi:hypothetical protein
MVPNVVTSKEAGANSFAVFQNHAEASTKFCQSLHKLFLCEEAAADREQTAFSLTLGQTSFE